MTESARVRTEGLWLPQDTLGRFSELLPLAFDPSNDCDYSFDQVRKWHVHVEQCSWYWARAADGEVRGQGAADLSAAGAGRLLGWFRGSFLWHFGKFFRLGRFSFGTIVKEVTFLYSIGTSSIRTSLSMKPMKDTVTLALKLWTMDAVKWSATTSGGPRRTWVLFLLLPTKVADS